MIITELILNSGRYLKMEGAHFVIECTIILVSYAQKSNKMGKKGVFPCLQHCFLSLSSGNRYHDAHCNTASNL